MQLTRTAIFKCDLPTINTSANVSDFQNVFLKTEPLQINITAPDVVGS